MNRRTKRVLIIDDEKDFGFFLKHNLVSTGEFTVDYVQNPQKGIQLARRKRPDVILLDIRMPSKDGITVLEELKGGARTLGIPVIMVTALEDEALKIKASGSYAQDYL
ncbi:MAG: response regulator, partial [Candidatus Omnitrophica bacterium]|nr:response regulator [Candidatus Omnitrophota bacterium]